MERELRANHWPAIAKLNLFLHVTGRREDGYHELQTLFQLIDYGDQLSFEVPTSGEIRRSGDIESIPEAVDLSVRAARLLKDATGSSQGVAITVDKRIPVGGGLGGGSSDAATTLLVLNRLWGLDMPAGDLAAIGLQLGADVPVFIHGRSAWAEGIGEKLEPIELAEQWYVVITPPVSVSTEKVFSNKDLTRDSEPITIRDFRAGRSVNQLEGVVRSEYNEVDKLLSWLDKFGEARMTGSGSSVFLPVGDEDAGEKILAQYPECRSGFVARGLNAHPILEMLGCN